MLDFAAAALSWGRNPWRRSSSRAARFSHSVVAVRSVRPFACARWIVRLARAVRMPILWNVSAISIATSATAARSVMLTYRATPTREPSWLSAGMASS